MAIHSSAFLVPEQGSASMLNLPMALLFVCVTFLAWGTYGILLHQGQHLMQSSLRSFVGVGIAYFLIAVLVPAFLLGRSKEKGFWSFSGTLTSLFAGVVGALGALGVLLAISSGGSPVYVMPLVFGFAPVVNTLVTIWLGKTYKQIKPLFVLGIALVALGAVGVLVFKPSNAAQKAKVEHVADSATSSPEITAETIGQDAATVSQTGGTHADVVKVTSVKPNYSGIVMSIIMAAVCWGAYGPFLHIGQMKMGGSRLRPFFCVGVSYFVIAVAAPVVMLTTWPDLGTWSVFGMTWSIAAGAAGAIGALGIIMAFNFGGKPVFVMPLVFGFAPVVNTLVSMALANSFSAVRPEFIACLCVVIAGAITVLVFAPKSVPHAAKSDHSTPVSPIATTATPFAPVLPSTGSVEVTPSGYVPVTTESASLKHHIDSSVVDSKELHKPTDDEYTTNTSNI